MKRGHVLLAGCGALLTTGFVSHPEARARPRLNPGSEVDLAEFLAMPMAIDPAFLHGVAGWHGPATLPARHVLPDLLPVTTQGRIPDALGTPGTCEAQSFGYGVCGYAASRTLAGTKRWDQTRPAHLPSAAWLYSTAHHLERKSCGAGSGAVVYLQQMVKAGAPSERSVPYNPACGILDPLYAEPLSAYAEAPSLRIGSFATFEIPKVSASFVKGYLAAGHAVGFSGPGAAGYADPPTSSAGIFSAPDGFPDGGHGQVIVGYDDDRGGPGVGAFLVQNSFGPQWADGGRIWWAYETVMQHMQLAAVAFPAATELAGRALAPNWPDAPAASVAGSKRTPGGLALTLQFASPIQMGTIALARRGKASRRFAYDAPFRSGIVLLPQAGPFVDPGRYGVEIAGRSLAGAALRYRAALEVA